MNKKLSTLVFTMLLFLLCGGMAHATYYHFENYGQTNVPFDLGDEVTWTFDLNNDSMGLWVIPEIPLNNSGTDWDKTSPYYSEGNMSPADYLHRAYLTMKFNTQGSEDEFINFTLDLTTITNWLLQQGGLPNQVYLDLTKLPDLQNAPGTLNVWSYLSVDHLLNVTIKSLQGDDFVVEKMNLSGCYETGSTPVPEPGTLILLGLGLALLPFLSRKKS